MIHIIVENNALKHRTFMLPDGIRKHLVNILKSYKGDKTVNGYKRLNNLLSSNSLSYYEMKRIKNFFDNYNGTDKSAEYILNGGEPMKLWVDNTLNTATASVKNYKQAMKDAGINNAFRKPHEKNRQTKKKNKPTLAKVNTNNLTKNIQNNTSVKFESKTQINERKTKDISMLIPKRIYNYIEKANAEYIKLKEYTEDDQCLIDFNGYFYGLSEPIYINKDYELICNSYYGYGSQKETFEDVVPLILYDEESDEYYFNNYWKDDTSAGSILKDAKRGLKYFKEYDPNKEDEDENYEENFMLNLTSETFTNKKIICINEHQQKEIYDRLAK